MAAVGPGPELELDRAPCGLLTTTPEGRILTINQTLLDWLGLERDEVVGRRALVDLLTGGGRIYHETHYRPALQLDGHAHEIAVDLRHVDGTRRPVLLSSVLELDDLGQPALVRTAVFTAAERRRYERELLGARERAEASESAARVIAQTLQRALMPPLPPRIEGLDVGAAFRPAGDGSVIGGDFFDVFELESTDWMVAIGDVCGKGVDAAAVAALARHSIRAAAVRHRSLDDVLRQVNQVLLRTDTDRYCTIALVRLTRSDHGWTLGTSCGGHPLPLLRRDGRIDVLGAPGGLVGIFPDPPFRYGETQLRSGDVVVLHTDGVTEARSEQGFAGITPLLDRVMASEAPAAELAGQIVAEAVAYQGGVTSDDAAVVVMRVP